MEAIFPETPLELEFCGSTKAERRKARKAERELRQFKRDPKPIEPRTPNQRKYIDSIYTNELTFGVGPAGVGKTYVASRVFGDMYKAGKISKIFAARPNVTKPKHRNGFLPGTLEEKTDPWLIPIFEGLQDSLGKTRFEAARKDGTIEVVPYEFIQGRTFKGEDGTSSACIVDEAENLDYDDFYITLTRQGEGLIMVMCGDSNQSRIPDSALMTIVGMSEGMDSVATVSFTEEDIVRSRQAKQWAKAFHRAKQQTYTLPTFITG